MTLQSWDQKAELQSYTPHCSFSPPIDRKLDLSQICKKVFLVLQLEKSMLLAPSSFCINIEITVSEVYQLHEYCPSNWGKQLSVRYY